MSGLNNYLRENYMSYLEDGRVCGILNETILQIIKDLEGEKEELSKDLENKNKRIETLLHHRKCLDEENQDIREDKQKLKKEKECLEKDYDWMYEELNRLYDGRKELKNLVDSYSDNVKRYKTLGENETMRDPEDESDVGKKLFSVKAKIKFRDTEGEHRAFGSKFEFVMARGWANAAEVFLKNTFLQIDEEIIEIEISHKPHIE